MEGRIPRKRFWLISIRLSHKKSPETDTVSGDFSNFNAGTDAGCLRFSVEGDREAVAADFDVKNLAAKTHVRDTQISRGISTRIL